MSCAKLIPFLYSLCGPRYEMMLEVPCQFCHSMLRVTNESLQGKKVNCPKCNRVILIPRAQFMDAVADVQVLEPDEEDVFKVQLIKPKNDEQNKQQTLLFLHGAAIGIGVAGMVGLILAVTWLFSDQGDSNPTLTRNDTPKAKISFNDPMAGELAVCRLELEKLYVAVRELINEHHAFPNVYGFVPSTSGELQPVHLSWRVSLLPYLNEKDLYDEFHFDESWDSPHNIQLVEKMPDIFRSPGVAKKGSTSIHMVSGEGMLFDAKAPISQKTFDKFISKAAFIVAGGDKASEWTKPDAIAWSDKAPLKSLGKSPSGNGYFVCFLNTGTGFFFVNKGGSPNPLFDRSTKRYKGVVGLTGDQAVYLGKHRLKYGDIFGVDAFFQSGSIELSILGFRPIHRNALKHFLASEFVQRRVSDWTPEASEVMLKAFEVQLSETIRGIAGKPQFQDGGVDSQGILVAMLEIKRALMEPVFTVPNLRRTLLVDLLIEAHHDTIRSEELDHCLLVAIFINYAVNSEMMLG